MARKQKTDYDLIVIGSGAGGSVAAHICNKAGLKVAIIEEDKVGGECPNVGCVPTKALLHSAKVYRQAKTGSKFGVRGTTVGYNYPSVKAWKDLAVERTGTSQGVEMFMREGISVVKGKARFLDQNTISVGSARLTSKKFLVATGSKLALPPVPGLDKSGYISYEGAIDLTRPPKTLAILGGGAIGCEFATIFSSFGTKVYIIDVADRLLSREEPETSQLVADFLAEDYSVDIKTGTFVDKVEKVGLGTKLHLRSGQTKSTLRVDTLLVATGKQGVVDIGLDNAGVKHDGKRILTDEYMQTSAKNIYAAGDCVGPYLFTHMSTYQSRIAANNMLHPRRKVAANYNSVPRCTFTDPEVASVGLTEAELKQAGFKTKSVTTPISVIGRANVADTNTGFAKVIADKKSDVILSATVVCPEAGEVIHELALAINQKLTTRAVADTIHAFPTWSEIVRVACAQLTKM